MTDRKDQQPRYNPHGSDQAMHIQHGPYKSECLRVFKEEDSSSITYEYVVRLSPDCPIVKEILARLRKLEDTI